MDTRKKEKCKINYLCVAFVLTSLFLTSNCNAQKLKTARLIKKVQDLPACVSPEQTDHLADELRETIDHCKNTKSALRLRYTLAMLHFKRREMKNAENQFSKIADANCPALLKIASLNMTAQTSRMIGKKNEALITFDRLVTLIKKNLQDQSENKYPHRLPKLLATAIFSRAEIFESLRDYDSAIREYRRLIEYPMDKKTGENILIYQARAADKTAQLHLHRGNEKKYLANAEKLCSDFPQYYRTPMVHFESACCKLMKKYTPHFQYAGYCSAIPARLVSALKKADPLASNTKAFAQDLLRTFELLTAKYKNTCTALIIQYHKAWVLDALGKNLKAAELLKSLCPIDITESNSQYRKITQLMQAYAGIQAAIIFTENKKYSHAMKALNCRIINHNNSVLSDLKKSVTKTIDVLKREVPAK